MGTHSVRLPSFTLKHGVIVAILLATVAYVVSTLSLWHTLTRPAAQAGLTAEQQTALLHRAEDVALAAVEQRLFEREWNTLPEPPVEQQAADETAIKLQELWDSLTPREQARITFLKQELPKVGLKAFNGAPHLRDLSDFPEFLQSYSGEWAPLMRNELLAGVEVWSPVDRAAKDAGINPADFGVTAEDKLALCSLNDVENVRDMFIAARKLKDRDTRFSDGTLAKLRRYPFLRQLVVDYIADDPRQKP